MRHWLLTASALLLLWTTTAASETVSPSQDAALSAGIDALFLRHIGPDTPGCAVGVYRRGETVLARGYGVANIEEGRPITPRSTFNLGSASVMGEVLFSDTTDEAFYPMTPAGGGRFFEIGRTGNVGRFSFRSSVSGAPLTLEVSWSDEPREVLERIAESALWRPSAAELSEYAGTWFSADLDAAWQIEPRGASLVLRRRGQRDLTLRAIAPDQFLRGFGPDGETSARLQFHRDNARSLTGLTLSTPPGDDSVRNLQFIRQPAK